MPQLHRMREFACPHCGQRVTARAKEVWHACPANRLRDTEFVVVLHDDDT